MYPETNMTHDTERVIEYVREGQVRLWCVCFPSREALLYQRLDLPQEQIVNASRGDRYFVEALAVAKGVSSMEYNDIGTVRFTQRKDYHLTKQQITEFNRQWSESKQLERMITDLLTMHELSSLRRAQ